MTVLFTRSIVAFTNAEIIAEIELETELIYFTIA